MKVHYGEINHRLQATYKHACSSNYRLPGMLRLTEHMQAILYITSEPFYEVLNTCWEMVIMIHVFISHAWEILEVDPVVALIKTW